MDRPGEPGATEPEGGPDACPCMSAHLHPGNTPAAPPHIGGFRRSADRDAAFDRWLRQELSRLYDTALAEPVPEDLLRLLRQRAQG